MKHTALFFIIALVVSCSSGGTFNIEGQLLNMNQGEILVYSPTNLINKIDTIIIQGGRFTYSRPVINDGYIVLVFPNFSQIPVFIGSGDKLELKGNAQQLNSLTINGSHDNELLTKFRIETKEKSPSELKKKAEEIIKDNPKSPVSLWLIEKYFVNTEIPDYQKALKLFQELSKENKENTKINEIISQLKILNSIKRSGLLQKFTATDIYNKTVSNETLKGKKTVIYLTGNWNYSNDIESNLREKINNEKNDINIVRINMDASKSEILRMMEHAEYKPITICDGKMFSSPLVKKLSLFSIGDNIILDEKGNIIARNIKPSELEKYI